MAQSKAERQAAINSDSENSPIVLSKRSLDTPEPLEEDNKKRKIDEPTLVAPTLSVHRNATNIMVPVEIYNREKNTAYNPFLEFQRLDCLGVARVSSAPWYIELNTLKFFVRQKDCFNDYLSKNWTPKVRNIIGKDNYNTCVIKIGQTLFISLEDLAPLKKSFSEYVIKNRVNLEFRKQLTELVNAYKPYKSSVVSDECEVEDAAKQDIPPPQNENERAVSPYTILFSSVLVSNILDESLSSDTSLHNTQQKNLNVTSPYPFFSKIKSSEVENSEEELSLFSTLSNT